MCASSVVDAITYARPVPCHLRRFHAKYVTRFVTFRALHAAFCHMHVTRFVGLA